MIDGQIHNIISVANVISEIKEILEEKHGPLKRVSVAAAGRALKTSKGSMSIDISESALIADEDVNRLELAAVQQAQQKLLSSDSISKDDYYYCVGYSVLYYKLDGEEIGNLIDQSGRSASVDVIATFLPRVVVESLLSALKRADLDMEALTLEPIAAINVLIPPSMRRLNVALVDIGAGTSDIAITDNNTVVAYGMVPIAGDKITESLSNHYLLDFPLAETAKRAISTKDEVLITDILGFEQYIPSDEMISVLKPAIQRLAQSISSEILKLNNSLSPKAVMVVGGGSLTPGLTREISICLGLPENRVAIRGLDALTGVTFEQGIPSSPELVTPIGIAIAAKRAPIHYMTVFVNDKTIRLFELKEMTISDALLAATIKAKQLYGKPGLGMTVCVNGNDMIIPGEHGSPSILLLNNLPASSKDFIKDGDSIELILGSDGKDASILVRDLLEDVVPIHATIDGDPVHLEPTVTINGEQKPIDSSIQDRDTITVTHVHTLSAALQALNKSQLLNTKAFTVSIDNKEVSVKNRTTSFFLGNMTISPSHILKEADEVTLQEPSLPTVEEVAAELNIKISDTITVTFNGAKIRIHKPRVVISVNGQPTDITTSVCPGDHLEFATVSDDLISFSDVFSFVDYTLPATRTSNYQLLRNGSAIDFNNPIFGGDILEIRFN
ncbi:cell division FtsA domain-containing protein [Filibacter tadaridae]|uniref:Cell division protein FtsA n=1 Tax=Filibacter tadaridae TaxID=2483811 RepID=A0A3P5XEA1_9BACL|nr:cell division FtsA domain-containing protein [Filibacter tadaridae]VDC26834.1 Cell division protein FtsA [Filibacter tadaridae]